MRKGRDRGGKKPGKKEEKTDGNCQQSTAQTPTAGTPYARAKTGNMVSPHARGLL